MLEIYSVAVPANMSCYKEMFQWFLLSSYRIVWWLRSVNGGVPSTALIDFDCLLSGVFNCGIVKGPAVYKLIRIAMTWPAVQIWRWSCQKKGVKPNFCLDFIAYDATMPKTPTKPEASSHMHHFPHCEITCQARGMMTCPKIMIGAPSCLSLVSGWLISHFHLLWNS